MESFKDRMRRARLRAGFKSQADAAREIGCERGTVSMWEAPSSPTESVSAEYLLSTARAYKVKPEWLNEGGKDDGYPWVGQVVEFGGKATAPRDLARRLGVESAGPSQSVKPETLTIAIQLVYELLDERRLTLPVPKRAQVISLVYALLEEGLPEAKVLDFARMAVA